MVMQLLSCLNGSWVSEVLDSQVCQLNQGGSTGSGMTSTSAVSSLPYSEPYPSEALRASIVADLLEQWCSAVRQAVSWPSTLHISLLTMARRALLMAALCCTRPLCPSALCGSPCILRMSCSARRAASLRRSRPWRTVCAGQASCKVASLTEVSQPCSQGACQHLHNIAWHCLRAWRGGQLRKLLLQGAHLCVQVSLHSRPVSGMGATVECHLGRYGPPPQQVDSKAVNEGAVLRRRRVRC